MEWQSVVRELYAYWKAEYIAKKAGVETNEVYCWLRGDRSPSPKSQRRLTKLLEWTKTALAEGRRLRYLRRPVVGGHGHESTANPGAESVDSPTVLASSESELGSSNGEPGSPARMPEYKNDSNPAP